MPSVNELLPIGESDLDCALPWDKIASVNFNRPTGEFYISMSTINELKAKSMSRQKSNDEFKYLTDNIDIFKMRNNQKLVSLNLQQRHLEKLKDQNVSRELEIKFNSLSHLVTPRKSVFLDIVDVQNLKSQAIRGESKYENPEFEKPEDLDIRLHETLRILSDWLDLLDNKMVSQHTIKN